MTEIYFNKNTKKLEERVKLKRQIITPNYSFPKSERNFFTFKYQKRYPGPGQYNIKTNNKLIYTFDKNRGSKFAFISIFDKFYKKSSKKSDRLYEEKLRYKERIYKERMRKIENFIKKEKNKYKPVLTSYDRFKNFEKIDYDKYKSLYLWKNNLKKINSYYIYKYIFI